MNKQTEALKLALELLDKQWQCTQVWSLEEALDVADNIREALAEQSAEIPQSITCPFCESQHVPGWLHDYNMDRMKKPASRPWVPLTEFDIDQIPYSCSHADSRLIAFAIEAKLREKNA